MSPLNHDRWHKWHTNLNMFWVFHDKIKSLSSKQPKLNFWNRIHQKKLHFYAICWHKQPPNDQTTQFWHQVSKEFWETWPTRFFGTKFSGGHNFSFTMGASPNEYSEADWMDPLLGKSRYILPCKSWTEALYGVTQFLDILELRVEKEKNT